MNYTRNRWFWQMGRVWAWSFLSFAGWALVGQVGSEGGQGAREERLPPPPGVVIAVPWPVGRNRRKGRGKKWWEGLDWRSGVQKGWEQGSGRLLQSGLLYGLWDGGGRVVSGWVVGLPLAAWGVGGIVAMWPAGAGREVWRGLQRGLEWGAWGALGLCVGGGEGVVAGVVPLGVGGPGGLRLRRPQREGVVALPVDVDKLLPPAHLARRVWAAVEKLDLSAFYGEIRVVEGGQGRAATDPALLIALWLYATTQGLTSARKVGRECVENVAYMWLCGGVRVSYKTLSAFRVAHQEKLEALLQEVVQHLETAGQVGWEAQAQDGMRVRASAGASSFHREGTLAKHLAQARWEEGGAESAEGMAEPGAPGPEGARERGGAESPAGAVEPAPPVTARERGARRRAVRERGDRLEAALGELPEVRAAKKPEEREEARVSSTDPQARVMKMADGGYRPAYNWQFIVDVAKRVIVGVEVVNTGSDRDQALPGLEQVEEDYQQVPEHWLMDGGFVNLEAIEELESHKHVKVVAPVPKPKDATRERYAPRPGDGPGVAAWRERMGTEEGQARYKQRGASVEWANAQARTRHGVYQVRVRGVEKVRSVALWVALTHNVLLWIQA